MPGSQVRVAAPAGIGNKPINAVKPSRTSFAGARMRLTTLRPESDVRREGRRRMAFMPLVSLRRGKSFNKMKKIGNPRHNPAQLTPLRATTLHNFTLDRN